MGNGKVRATRHNGRKGANGVFKAGHNDRSFHLENAEHIDEDRSKLNVYWDVYQGYNLADENGVRPARKFLFEQVEYLYYHEHFGDSIDAQNERHEKSRHRERIRSVRQILEDPRTCPEETVYQLGTKDGYEDPALFAQVAAELFEEFQKRYGSHVQILDWALHMDEATPHIHERHVFFNDDGYGMNFPKQEKACESLGFERPNPDKKQGRNNNRKMSFDEEVRKLYIEIAEKHGVLIEKVPLEGKVHMEKNDFIISKQEAEIMEKQARLNELTLKIEDMDDMADEIAQKAYEKACEVVAYVVCEETIHDDISTVEKYRDCITSPEHSGTREQKKLAGNVLNRVAVLLRKKTKEIAVKIRQTLMSPDVKKRNEAEIAETARVSMKHKLAEKKKEADKVNAAHAAGKHAERGVRE